MANLGRRDYEWDFYAFSFSFNVSDVLIINFIASHRREAYLGIEKKEEKII